MRVLDSFFVETVSFEECKPWLLKKHYAHRMPMAVEFSFGLYDTSKNLCGVCVFGPTAPPVPKTLFGSIEAVKVRELTRLVVNEELKKNTLSFFVSKAIRMLPRPMCLVSYADKNAGHHGYIYQATNWFYTGTGGGETNIIDINGNPVHNITITDGCTRERINRKQYFEKHGLSESEALPKFRYVFFIGNKKEKKDMINLLKVKILPYPKGDNFRYDIGEKIKTQKLLF